MTARGGAKLLATGVSVVVAAAVIVAIVLIDPPRQRLERLDERRVGDLRDLQSRIETYRERHGRLPSDLDALGAEPGLGRLPTDPETGEAYGYATLDEKRFRLCATFLFETQESDGYGLPAELDWSHGAGRFCFDRKTRHMDDAGN